MAKSWNEFVTTVKLNTEEAKDKLKELQKETEQLKKKRDEVINDGGDKKAVKDFNKQIKKNEREMATLQKQTKNVIDTINNMDSSSLNDLLRAERLLNSEMKKTPQNTEYFKELATKLQSVKASIAGIREATKNNYAEVKSLKDETENLNYVLGNLNTASMKDLSRAATEAKRRMQEAAPDSAEYSQAAASLKTIETRIKEVNRAQQQANTAIDKYNDEINRTAKDTLKVQQETKLIDNTLANLSTAKIREMEYTVKVLNERLRETDRGTEAYHRLENQLKQVKTELQAVAAEQQVATKQSTWSRFAQSMNQNFLAVSSVIASLTGLTMSVRKSVEAYADMDQEMNNVRKYTGQSMEEVKQLNEVFKKTNTRTAREELNQLAGSAGRLGITANKTIQEFVDGADKINVALGDDLGQGAVDKIGKLAQVFGEDKTKGLRGAMLATGSAVNELAQNSSANAGYIVDFTADLAGVGRQANMTQAELMGIASALDQNMQEEATSSTVFSQLITKMYQDPAKFAKLAGEDVSKFTKMLKTDANEALLTFLQAMQNKGGFDALAPMFQQMNLDGTRAVGVLSAVATHLDQVRDAQKLANEAYSQGTSVINEFNIQNNTEQAKLEKAKKQFKEITIELGEKLLPIARYGISTTSIAIRLLSTLVNFVSKYKTTIIALTATITALIAVEEMHIIKEKLIDFWNKAILSSCKKLWAVLIAHPYIAVAGAVAALVTWLINLNTQTNKNAEIQKELNSIEKTAAERAVDETTKIKTLEKAMNNGNLSMKERKKAAEQLNSIIPGFNAQLDATRKRYVANKNKLDEYIKSLVHMYEVMGAKDRIKQLGKERADAKLALEDAKKQQKQAEDLNKRINDANRKSYVAPTQAETAFLNQNVSAATDKVRAAEKRVNEIDKKVKAINDMYGDDIQKSEVNKPDTEIDPNNGLTGNTGVSDKEAKARENQHKKEEAERKKHFKEEVQAQKDKIAQEQADNTFAYATQGKLYRDYLNDKHDIAEKGYEAIKKIYEKYGEDTGEIEQKISDERKNRMQDNQKASIKEIENEQAAKKAMANEDYYNPSSDIYLKEAALQERLFQIDMEAQQKKINTLQAGSEEWLDAKDEMEQMQLDHSAELQQQYAERLSRYREQWGKTDIETQKQIELNGLKDLLDKKLIMEQEYEEMKKQIELQYELQLSEQAKENSHNAITNKNAHTAYQTASNYAEADEGEKKPTLGSYLTSDITRYASTFAYLKEMYEDDEITFEEYQVAKSEAFGVMMEGITDKAQSAFDSISQIMDGMSSYYDAQSQYEQNVVSKKYEKQINAAGNNSAKKKKLEEKEQKEIAKIKTKYNKKAMKIELAKATAQMILGAMSAYTSAFEGAPYPANLVLAPIAAGIAMAAGMLNLATIKKQHAAEEAGYYSGGFTGGTSYRRTAGVVHEGEFVANHQAVNNPNVMPVLQLIDAAQRNNTIGSLTANDVTRQLGQGGTSIVSAPTVNVQTDNSELRDTLDEARDTIERLGSLLDRGIKANVIMEEFKKEETHWNKITNNK